MLFNNGYKEAESMKNHLLKNNIPEQDIIIENTSRNTKENRKFENLKNESDGESPGEESRLLSGKLSQ